MVGASSSEILVLIYTASGGLEVPLISCLLDLPYFPTEIIIYFSPIRSTCPTHPILPDFITGIILGDEQKSRNFTFCHDTDCTENKVIHCFCAGFSPLDLPCAVGLNIMAAISRPPTEGHNNCLSVFLYADYKMFLKIIISLS